MSTANTNHINDVKFYTELFANKLKSLMCDGLSVGGENCDNYGIQDFLYSFDDHYAINNVNASQTVEPILNDLHDSLQSRASFLSTIQTELQSKCQEYNKPESTKLNNTIYNTIYAQETYAQNSYSTLYGRNISLHSGIRVPYTLDINDQVIQQDIEV